MKNANSLSAILILSFVILQSCSLMEEKHDARPLVEKQTMEVNSPTVEPEDFSSLHLKKNIPENNTTSLSLSDQNLFNTIEHVEPIDRQNVSVNSRPLEITSETLIQPINTPLHIQRNENLLIEASNNAKSFKPGEILNLVVKTKLDGHLYCFYNDASNNFMRVFPNRFNTESKVNAGKELLLPGAMPFEISANKEGKTENISCFLTNSEILPKLPDSIKVLDFAKLKASSMDEIQQNILNANGSSIFAYNFTIIVN